MRAFRLLAAAAALLSVSAAHADQVLAPARIDGSNRIVMPGGPTLGLWSGGKYTAKPDALQIQGAGSTGDVSGMSVTPSGAAASGTLARILADQVPKASPTFTGTMTAPTLALTGTGSTGDLSSTCTIAPWASRCRAQADRLVDTINVLDAQVPADAGVRDDVAIQAALNAAATRGGATVILPPRATCYVLSAPLTVTANTPQYNYTLLKGGGAGTCLKPGATMDSMVTVTGRFASVEGISFINQNSYATNAVKLSCGGVGNINGWLWVQSNYFTNFVNGVKNADCDGWQVSRNWFQSSSGWDVWSADNGTTSRVTNNYSLGSAGNVLYDRVNYQVEGVYITGNVFLPTAGFGIEIRACLSCYVESNQVDQTTTGGLYLNGTKWPIADFGVSNNWFGTQTGSSVPVDIDIAGNVADVRLVANTVSGAKNCGLRMRGATYTPSGGSAISASVQRVAISGLRANGNGTAANSADICVDTSVAAVINYTVRDSFLLSKGGFVQSVVEGAGAIGFWTNNRFDAGLTKSATSTFRDNWGDDVDTVTGKYAAWTTYTPTATCASGSYGTAPTVTGRYRRERNTVNLQLRVMTAASGNGTCAGSVYVTLPSPIATGAWAVLAGHEANSNKMVHGFLYSASTIAQVNDYAGAYPGGNGTDLLLSGTYEVTP